MRALVLTDLQVDFCPGGALPVPRGDEVIPVANRLAALFGLVVATQDRHPPGHLSFAASHPGRKPGETIDLLGLPQVLWPVHCVQGTPGADFHPAIDRAPIARVFHKGVDREIDSYSGFFDNGHRRATGLGEFLEGRGVTDVYLCGLATDYCVKWSALDAVSLGFRVFLVPEACRAIDLRPGDGRRAIEEMESHGVQVVPADEIAPEAAGRGRP